MPADEKRSAAPSPSGIHAALIMDGNGRWAAARGEPRNRGHEAGARRLRDLASAAPGLGIGTLSLFAFSSRNWSRPEAEVRRILELVECYLRDESRRAADEGALIRVLGRRDRLPPSLLEAIDEAEARTPERVRLVLRLAVDYSSRERITAALREAVRRGVTSEEGLTRMVGEVSGDGGPAPDVDLLVRTGGEQRLSDFLLWECAYAEFVFTETPWPDFGVPELRRAVEEFRCRDRRFGRVPGQEPGEGPSGGRPGDGRGLEAAS